jgi:hypothetical protein
MSLVFGFFFSRCDRYPLSIILETIAQQRVHHRIDFFEAKRVTVSVSPNMLFRGLFIAFNPKIYLENPDWYIKLRMKLRNPESGIQNPLQDELFIQLLNIPG